MKRWQLVLLIAGLFSIVVIAPIVVYRQHYTDEKRLREIIPGRIYRSGQMTAAGFANAVRLLKIQTVVNLQDDFPDPDIYDDFWNWHSTPESEMCGKLGVRYVLIKPDLVSRHLVHSFRPAAIDEMLDLLDDESNYPVLIHCKAGLHRTGVLSAVIRMEYQGWSPDAAYRELKAHGFGDWVCTSSNDYVYQYVLNYHPYERHVVDRGCLIPSVADNP